MFQLNLIKDLINWIQAHLDEPLSIAKVAEKAGYSQWYLQRVFKHVTGYSMANYIRTQRLNYAAQELKSSRVSIAEVAFKYQFDSQQSFSRAFKKLFFQTPSDYRRT